MTTPTDTDLEAAPPPSHLARVVALSTLQTTADDLGDLDPILNQALGDANLQQAGVLLRRVDAAQELLATLREMVERRLAVLTGANGVFPINGGLVVERTGGRSTSRRKSWDRSRLIQAAAKKAAALAWKTDETGRDLGDFVSDDLLAVAEQAATLALGCVPSDWRLPGLRALGLDPERYSDEAAPSAIKFIVRPDERPAIDDIPAGEDWG